MTRLSPSELAKVREHVERHRDTKWTIRPPFFDDARALLAERDALEAELSEMTEDRDSWRRVADSYEDERLAHRRERDALKARVVELEVELREIEEDRSALQVIAGEVRVCKRLT